MKINHQVANLPTIARSAKWGAVAAIATALITSCATTERKAKAQEAIVCPQCKMVAVTSMSPNYSGFPANRWGGGASTRPHPVTTYDHRCPGCQGVLTTFFREGKLKHKCSVCNETPFSCPVLHPKTSN